MSSANAATFTVGTAGSLTVTAVTNAATTLGGAITLGSSGAFTYTPAVGVSGPAR